MGTNNVIGPYCVLHDGTKLGDNNTLTSHVSIGSPAEHKTQPCTGGVEIGNSNIIREFVTINAALKGDTWVGDECYIMTKSHIGHDAYIESEVTLSCLSIIGGHSIIMRGANVGLSATVHQFRVVGQHSMVGMNSTVSRSIPPYVVAMGSPCRPHRVNRIGLQRRNHDQEMIEAVEGWFQEYTGGPTIKHKMSKIVEEQIARWDDRVKSLGGN